MVMHVSKTKSDTGCTMSKAAIIDDTFFRLLDKYPDLFHSMKNRAKNGSTPITETQKHFMKHINDDTSLQFTNLVLRRYMTYSMHTYSKDMTFVEWLQSPNECQPTTFATIVKAKRHIDVTIHDCKQLDSFSKCLPGVLTPPVLTSSPWSKPDRDGLRVFEKLMKAMFASIEDNGNRESISTTGTAPKNSNTSSQQIWTTDTMTFEDAESVNSILSSMHQLKFHDGICEVKHDATENAIVEDATSLICKSLSASEDTKEKTPNHQATKPDRAKTDKALVEDTTSLIYKSLSTLKGTKEKTPNHQATKPDRAKTDKALVEDTTSLIYKSVSTLKGTKEKIPNHQATKPDRAKTDKALVEDTTSLIYKSLSALKDVTPAAQRDAATVCDRQTVQNTHRHTKKGTKQVQQSEKATPTLVVFLSSSRSDKYTQNFPFPNASHTLVAASIQDVSAWHMQRDNNSNNRDAITLKTSETHLYTPTHTYTFTIMDKHSNQETTYSVNRRTIEAELRNHGLAKLKGSTRQLNATKPEVLQCNFCDDSDDEDDCYSQRTSSCYF
jgi:hypothetical protein